MARLPEEAIPEDIFHLQRLLDAQAGCFDSAAAEFAVGGKTGHWMWFIFPQMRGLGQYPDDLKFRSSLTLFTQVEGTPDGLFRQTLNAFFTGEEGARTLDLLRRGGCCLNSGFNGHVVGWQPCLPASVHELESPLKVTRVDIRAKQRALRHAPREASPHGSEARGGCSQSDCELLVSSHVMSHKLLHSYEVEQAC